MFLSCLYQSQLYLFMFFCIDAVNNLKVEVAFVEECIVVELMENKKGIGGKTTFMFTGLNALSRRDKMFTLNF